MAELRPCLGCQEKLPLSDFAYSGRARFCDPCRWRGLTLDERQESRRIARLEYRWRNIVAVRKRDRAYARSRYTGSCLAG